MQKWKPHGTQSLSLDRLDLPLSGLLELGDQGGHGEDRWGLIGRKGTWFREGVLSYPLPLPTLLLSERGIGLLRSYLRYNLSPDRLCWMEPTFQSHVTPLNHSSAGFGATRTFATGASPRMCTTQPRKTVSLEPSRTNSREPSQTLLGPWCLASLLVSSFKRKSGSQT